MAIGALVVVRQGAVKRVLPGCEFCRKIITSMGRIRIVVAAVALRPILVPRAGFVRHRVILARFFTDPKDRRYDLALPWETLPRFWGRRLEMSRRECNGIGI